MDIDVEHPKVHHAAVGLKHRSTARFLCLIAREARPVVLLVYVVRMAAAVSNCYSQSSSARPIPVLLAVVSMCLAVVCVYLFNGLADAQQDRLNGSGRPLAEGELTAAQVRRTIWCIVAVIAAAGVVLPLPVSACNAAMLLLGYCYSSRRLALKRHRSASLLVASAGVALAYLTVVFAAGGRVEPAILGSMALLAAWVWAGGPTKDFSDVQGDALEGRRTLPLEVGERRARAVIAARVSAVALAMTAASITNLASVTLLVAPVFAVVLVAASSHSVTGSDRHQQRRLYRLFMLTQFGLNAAFAVAPLAL